MNVVDSSGWIEYFAGGPNAEFFTPAVEDLDALLVPTLTLTEVYRHVHRQRGEAAAIQVVAAMRQGRVIPLTADLAVGAARVGLEHRLPLADSIILATARAFGAKVWTQDADFKELPEVAFVKHRRR